jgi:UDP-N-acetylglucosamine--N-acetylmuramyl-(pentapeptide) pyrophosphoryl-undecaprenol N-acetylglucosamine transferase
MDLAYEVADVVVCRAGALTISELCLLGQAAILIPSPNVAEDHQTQNAMALTDKEAAILVPDAEASAKIIASAQELLADPDRLARLSGNVKKLAKPDAADTIAEEVLKLARK